jgi:hypothetical protein
VHNIKPFQSRMICFLCSACAHTPPRTPPGREASQESTWLPTVVKPSIFQFQVLANNDRHDCSSSLVCVNMVNLAKLAFEVGQVSGGLEVSGKTAVRSIERATLTIGMRAMVQAA